ncbi:hypothetical protein KFY49_25470, partial [Salmonella enterica subsp. enterica serovar 1,4,[5],12:i:-]|nr:hypothetical protein [Salmonella enterica subsp. enterica serovar 1,4,[5],12:i:-]
SCDEDDRKENPDRRTSRRQKGLQPEHGLLPEQTRQPQVPTPTAATMTDPMQPAPILLRQPKEPTTFRGSSF